MLTKRALTAVHDSSSCRAMALQSSNTTTPPAMAVPSQRPMTVADSASQSGARPTLAAATPATTAAAMSQVRGAVAG